MTRPVSTLLLASLLATSLAACDWFRPADPEAPSSIATFVPDYSRPDSTLATIARAVADKGRSIGSTAYDGAFADSATAGSVAGYHQFFSDQDIAVWSQGHDVPDWGFREEHAFYPKFVGGRLSFPDAYQLEWTKDDDNPDVESDGILFRHYLITTHAADGSRTRTIAVGYVRLKFLQFSDGNWRIIRWDDRIDPQADPGDPEQITWGRRRLNTTQ